MIRKTHVDEKLVPGFREVVNQVLQVTGTMYTAAAELIQLAETSFEGAGATRILELISNLGEEEWKSDRLQRKLSREVYDMEAELDPVTISFYEKMQRALGQIADSAENTGDMLRAMIGKG